MTTIIPFRPSNIKAPTIQVTLDGFLCDIVITWNVSAQRYYINIYNQTFRTWVTTVPLIATPPARAIISADYLQTEGVVQLKMIDPALWPFPMAPGGIAIAPGTMVDYTLEKFEPVTYNGLFRSLQVDNLTFKIPMASDPGPVQVLGFVSRYLNMAAGVFETSTLIYRNGSFEVNP